MPNLYGVSNPVPLPVFIAGLTNTNCPAGAETTIWQAQLVAPSKGLFYPVVWIYQVYLLGATAPSQILVALRVQGGSDMQTIALPSQFLTASGTPGVASIITGTASDLIYQPPGAIVQVTVNPTGQPVTMGTSGVYSQFFLFRAPDQ